MNTAAPRRPQLTAGRRDRSDRRGCSSRAWCRSPRAGTPPPPPWRCPTAPRPTRCRRATAGTSTEPYLTPDGQQVFFTSTASNLVTGDDNGVADVFGSVAIQGSDDPFTGQPTLISVPDGPVGATRANDASSEPVASADGRYVAFTSTATNLVAGGGTAGRRSVYVRDTLLDTTIRVQGAAEPDGASYDPDISDDGHVRRLHLGGHEPVRRRRQRSAATRSSRTSTRTATASWATSRSRGS